MTQINLFPFFCLSFLLLLPCFRPCWPVIFFRANNLKLSVIPTISIKPNLSPLSLTLKGKFTKNAHCRCEPNTWWRKRTLVKDAGGKIKKKSGQNCCPLKMPRLFFRQQLCPELFWAEKNTTFFGGDFWPKKPTPTFL